MGLKGMIAVFFLFALSFLVIDAGLPFWITSNTSLHNLTYILWLVAFSIAFVKYGLE